MSTPLIRSELSSIPSYKAGKDAPQVEGVERHKLSSNENPFTPLPSVLRVAEQALADMHRYPDYASTDLVAAISEHFDVPVSDIAVGTGSVGLLQQLMQIALAPGDSVVYAWRSFEAYPIIATIVGATSYQVPLDEQDRHDLSAMADAIDDTTKMVIVCNPNNPTSTAVNHGALRDFLNVVPPHVLVVIDEAYCEFVNGDLVPDGLVSYRAHQNVAVLRTFSKAYGLAALRVGYCVAHAPVADALRKDQVPFGVSTIAQRAAVASLAASGELLARVGEIVDERRRVVAALQDVGFSPAESEANFLWLGLGPDTAAFAAACEEQSLSVRPFAGDGVRITIGSAAANDRLVSVAANWLATR